jgi:hypothetical protein
VTQADELHLEVVVVDTRHWGEEGGSYSPDRRYRWRYERPIGSGPAICWVGLNPGTGDREGRYRPTLQRMVDRSVQMGMGTFILVNLFSWRGTDPHDLRAAVAAGHDIIGSATDQVIADSVERAAVVVAAWGHHGTLLGREREVLDTIPDVMCVGLTAKGHPRHPLYVSAAQPLVPLQSAKGT